MPDLGIPRIKCKVDTGARSSALHAFFIETFRERGKDRVRFGIHPKQRRTTSEKVCCADVLDQRVVTSSDGNRQTRIFISTLLVIGEHRVPIEASITDRDNLRFRMLLGRTAFRGDFVVDASRSYVAGLPRLEKIQGENK